MKEIKVSVIVPVYNSEVYLRRCVDSLVYQTLEEIEILLVDNQSTDDSYDIMKCYAQNYPDKVRIFKLDEHYDGPGAGRNLGIKNARANYIGFADSDDFFEYDAFEKMYEKAITEDCDLIYCASYDVKDGEKRITRALPHGTREEILFLGSMVFWNKLIHKDLFVDMGDIPTDMVFEDMAYCSGVVSKAKKIGYIGEPLYYYIIREDSGVNTLDPERVLKELEAIDISLDKCKDEYKDVWLQSVAMRLCNDIRDRWQFTDAYIRKLKSMEAMLLSDELILRDRRNYPRIKRYLMLPDNTIPKTVYTNCSEEKWNNEKTKFFYDDYNVVEIEKCEDNRKNVLQALELIYKMGGVFVDSSIKVVAPLNCFIYNEAFFSYYDEKEFSSKVFGAKKNNSVIKRIMDLSLTDEEKSIGNVIYEVLHNELDIPMNNKTNEYDYDVSVYDLTVFVFDDGDKFHVTEHCDENDKKCIKMSRSSLQFYFKNKNIGEPDNVF